MMTGDDVGRSEGPRRDARRVVRKREKARGRTRTNDGDGATKVHAHARLEGRGTGGLFPEKRLPRFGARGSSSSNERRRIGPRTRGDLRAPLDQSDAARVALSAVPPSHRSLATRSTIESNIERDRSSIISNLEISIGSG